MQSLSEIPEAQRVEILTAIAVNSDNHSSHDSVAETNEESHVCVSQHLDFSPMNALSHWGSGPLASFSIFSQLNNS